MKDYCTKCSLEIFGKEREPELNIEQMFEALQPGFMTTGMLCEGCGLVAVTRTEDNELKVVYSEWEGEELIYSEPSDYIKKLQNNDTDE